MSATVMGFSSSNAFIFAMDNSAGALMQPNYKAFVGGKAEIVGGMGSTTEMDKAVLTILDGL